MCSECRGVGPSLQANRQAVLQPEQKGRREEEGAGQAAGAPGRGLGQAETRGSRAMKRGAGHSPGSQGGLGATGVGGDSSGISEGTPGPAPALTRPLELDRLSKPN